VKDQFSMGGEWLGHGGFVVAIMNYALYHCLHVFRMCREPHTTRDGEGARLAGGRWNPKGTPVIYASQSEALAYLEVLVGIRSSELSQGISFAS
jgi:hypothetical protein